MAKLERMFTYALLIVLIVGVVIGYNNILNAENNKEDRITVQEISIVNEEGNKVIKLGYDENGNGLITVFDKTGKQKSVYGFNGIEEPMFKLLVPSKK